MLGTSSELTGLRVLVAEDNEDIHSALASLLELSGCVVTVVEDGQAAFERAMAGEFDIVLMDVQMPHVDGLEATRRLRRAGYEGPIIALTASALPDERRHCMQAGCTDHVSKPIRYERLLERLHTLGRARRLGGC